MTPKNISIDLYFSINNYPHSDVCTDPGHLFSEFVFADIMAEPGGEKLESMTVNADTPTTSSASFLLPAEFKHPQFEGDELPVEVGTLCNHFTAILMPRVNCNVTNDYSIDEL